MSQSRIGNGFLALALTLYIIGGIGGLFFLTNDVVGYVRAGVYLVGLAVVGWRVAQIANLHLVMWQQQRWERSALKQDPVKRASISPQLRRYILHRDQHYCSYCGEHGTTEKDPDGNSWEIDHVIPCSRGGETHPRNLTLACFHCNREKSDKTPVEYLRYIQSQLE